jgi:hypothetical protein
MAATLSPGVAFEQRQAELSERVTAIVDRYPLYEGLAAPAAAV